MKDEEADNEENTQNIQKQSQPLKDNLPQPKTFIEELMHKPFKLPNEIGSEWKTNIK